MTESTSYFRATHHPWLCLLFLFPLLAVYEGGVYLLGGTNPQSLRNGADAWLRWVLDIYSVKPYLAARRLLLPSSFGGASVAGTIGPGIRWESIAECGLKACSSHSEFG